MTVQIVAILPKKLFLNKSSELYVSDRTLQQQRIVNGMLQTAGVCNRDKSGAEGLKWLLTLGIQ